MTLTPRRFLDVDLALWLAMLVTAVVVVPRSLHIVHLHSPAWDDQGHLRQGLAFLTNTPQDWFYIDPPFMQGVMALPMLITGWRPPASGFIEGEAGAVLFQHTMSPDATLMMIVAWRCLLFIPAAGAIFAWVRRMYGQHSAWLMLAMVLIDPTIAAHLATATMDVPVMMMIALACIAGWRYFEKPGFKRALVASLTMAAAMLTKQTAIILPGVLALFAVVASRKTDPTLPVATSNSSGLWRKRINQYFVLLLLLGPMIWALTLFDLSRPRDVSLLLRHRYSAFSLAGDVINPLMEFRVPAGKYVGSIIYAYGYGNERWCYLFGQLKHGGWWYYLPVVATYKVPIGIGLVLVLGLISFVRRRPTRIELSCIIPMFVWSAFLMWSHVSLGFRHALPVYLLMMILASRCVSGSGNKWRVMAWSAVAIAAFHVARFHPDELSYVNFPREQVWLQVNESNLDWGQSLKQVGHWLDEHPQDRPVYLAYFGDPLGDARQYYLGERVIHLEDDEPAPVGVSGILIISPVLLAGAGWNADPYAPVRELKPIDQIEHSMLVYDLSQLTPEVATRARHRPVLQGKRME